PAGHAAEAHIRSRGSSSPKKSCPNWIYVLESHNYPVALTYFGQAYFHMSFVYASPHKRPPVTCSDVLQATHHASRRRNVLQKDGTRDGTAEIPNMFGTAILSALVTEQGEFLGPHSLFTHNEVAAKNPFGLRADIYYPLSLDQLHQRLLWVETAVLAWQLIGNDEGDRPTLTSSSAKWMAAANTGTAGPSKPPKPSKTLTEVEGEDSNEFDGGSGSGSDSESE
ncbi:hypothetical protein B0H14DRAFT_3758989, partial [Mycena olivaceomarginata]